MRNKLLSVLLVVCIIFSITLGTYIQCSASLVMLPIIGWAIPQSVAIVGSLLIAAGVTFTANKAIEYTVDWFIDKLNVTQRQKVYDMCMNAEDGIANIDEETWNFTRDIIQSNFTVGENIVEGNGYYLVYIQGQYVPVYDGPIHSGGCVEFPPLSVLSYNLNYNDGANNYNVYDEIEEIDGKYNYTIVFQNKAYPTVKARKTVYDVDITKEKGLYQYAIINAYGKVQITGMGYAYSINKDAYEVISANTGSLIVNITQEEWMEITQEIVVTGEEVISIPDWDFANTETGEREIGYPVSGSIEDLVNKKYEDVIGKAKVGEKTWLEKIYSKIAEGVNSIVTAIENVATGENVAEEEDLTEKMTEYKISDIFGLFLSVFLACVRLVIRALMFLFSLMGVEEYTGYLDEYVLQGYNFMKNYSLPMFGMTFFDLFITVACLCLSIVIVKRVKGSVT